MLKTLDLVKIISLTILLVACGEKKSNSEAETTESEAEEMGTTLSEETDMAEPPMAIAAISSASGSTLSGEANFIQNNNESVDFSLSVTGASPGEHAIHLHAMGDCSAPDATSAGGHWNPAEVDHGKRGETPMFHAGDIDNLMVGEDGTGSLNMTVKGWTIGGADSTNVIGKAIIIHAAADDFTSQPSGAAGPRVGCGVVTVKM